MVNTNGVTNDPLTQLGLLKQNEENRENLGQADFLELLVAQMSHQNPLEPQSNGEFLAQMAQFGTVDGINNLQKSFSGLSNALQSSKALQASALVGRSVQVPTSQAELTSGGTVKGSLEVTSSTSDILLSIHNKQGELIKQISLGSQAPGNVGFEWDGTTTSGTQAPMGDYVIRATGMQGGESTSLSVNVARKVDSVILDKDGLGIHLNVSGVGVIPLEQVKQIN